MFNVSISGGLDIENTSVSKSGKFRTAEYIVTTVAACYQISDKLCGCFYSSVSRNSVNLQKSNIIS
jgi:hypothetical protein